MTASSGVIHVLHVDDEPDFSGMAAEFVQRQDEQLEVETATSSSEGLERLSQNGYECIVSDFDMPGQTGIEFLKAVREDHTELPFILYTGKGSEEVASEAISAGVTEYLQKEGGTGQYTVLANRIRNAVEQRRAKAALAEREQRLNQFFEQSPLGVIRWDDEFNFVRLNETASDILGYSEDELIGEPWEVVISDEDREEIGEVVVSDLLENDGGYHSINENVRKDGERIVCEWHNWVVTDHNGDVESVFSQFEEITDRKERERELRETKSQLETTVNEKERQNEAFHTFLDIVTDSTRSFDQQMHDVLSLGVDFLELDIGLISNIDPPDYTVEHVVTPDGSIEQGDVLDFSDTFCSLVYESDGPVAFRSPTEGGVEDHPCYQDLGLEAYLGVPLLVDGQRYGTLNFSSPSPREESFTDGERAFIRTVSKWVTTELSRRTREQKLKRYAAMTETVQDGICILNRDSEFVEVNDAFTKLTGYDRSELLGSHASLVRPEELNEAFDQMQASLESESDVESIEMDVQHADGHTRVVNARYGEFSHEEGLGRVGVWRDITDRKQ